MSKYTYEDYIKIGCNPVGYNTTVEGYVFGRASLDLLLDKISDLEAKLAESEENNKLLEMQLQDMERSKLSWENQYFTLYNTLKNYREVTEKKHLLDEIEWQDYCAYKHIEPQIKGCLDREKELKQQLTEKDEEIKDLNYRLDLKFVNYTNSESIKFLEDQDKISFAVEQLEKFRDIMEKLNENNSGYIIRFSSMSDREKFHEALDNQIKAIKEGK